MSITSSRRTNFATVFMIVAIFLFASFRSGESNHPNRFVNGNDYYHLHESDISGYKCPSGSKVNQRAPKASTACPAGSDPAVVIKWGYVGQKPSTGTSSGIFQSFGKTNMRVHRNKRMCSSEAGNFHTGEPDDPYPLLTLAQGSDVINRVLKNKKVVQVWGHAMALMCSRGRPRVRLTLNADDDERRTIMPNTWTDEENDVKHSSTGRVGLFSPCRSRRFRRFHRFCLFLCHFLHPFRPHRLWPKKSGYGTQSVLCVPIMDGDGNVMAVAQMINKMPLGKAFDEDDIHLFDDFAIHV